MLKETVEIKVDYEKAGVSSEGCAPVLDCYYNTLTEEIGRKKHKAIIICPGGGYDWCSEREAEPVAFRFLGAGICAFVLRYSCVKKKFPTDALECGAAVKYVRDNAEKFDIVSGKTYSGNLIFSAVTPSFSSAISALFFAFCTFDSMIFDNLLF